MNTQRWCGIGLCLMVWAAGAQATEVDATLQWARRVPLSTPVSGVVLEVRADEGQSVRAGDILLLLDQRGFQAHLNKAQADMVRSRITLQEAKREQDRTKELYDRTLLADHDVEVANIAYATAEAAHKAVEAALVHAELDFQYSAIRAPFDGVVVGRNVEVGQTVVSELQAQPLLVLAQAGVMLARATVGLDVVDKLRLGQELSVSVGKARYRGHVHALGLEPVEGGRYAMVVQFDTKGAQLRPGTPAKLVLP